VIALLYIGLSLCMCGLPWNWLWTG